MESVFREVSPRNEFPLSRERRTIRVASLLVIPAAVDRRAGKAMGAIPFVTRDRMGEMVRMV